MKNKFLKIIILSILIIGPFLFGGRVVNAQTYKGCWTDNASRALPNYAGGGFSIDSCIQWAKDRGFSYAGLQWYDQCFAGNTLSYTQVGGAECNTVCTYPSPLGLGTYCGGSYRNSIYTVPIPAPPPSCSSAGPDGDTTSATTGFRRTYAYGVQNVGTSPFVNFAAWSDVGGQDDIIWYPGVNDGGGTWHADINLANHPGLGTINVHVYLYGSSTPFCDYASFTRVAIVTGIAGTGGSVSPASQTVSNWNQTTSFAITPSAGYSMGSVSGCGGSLSGNTYTTGIITGACTVSATFTSLINNASCTSITAPSSVTVGQNFSATVVMQNVGTKTWQSISVNPNQSHRLGSQDPQDNGVWSLYRVDLPVSSVAPGDSATFTFNATAPATSGTYNFNWKMLQDGVEWFGTRCIKSITVTTLPPSCSSAGPKGETTAATTGTRREYAYGVNNTSAVYFPTWTDANGQDDLIWYPGTNTGGGTWYADINLANHTGLGLIYVDVWLSKTGGIGGDSSNWAYCDGAQFTRVPPNACYPIVPNPANYGNACTGSTSAPNACGQTNGGGAGTYQCNGSCSGATGTTPANPANYGNACTGSTSAPNACGQTNGGGAGTYQCNGSCSGATGTTPANSNCVVACGACSMGDGGPLRTGSHPVEGINTGCTEGGSTNYLNLQNAYTWSCGGSSCFELKPLN